MKSRTWILVGVATVSLFVFVALTGRRKRPPVYITSEDLGYQEHSPAELASAHLLDLNAATRDDLTFLGLDGDTVDRILDNRPYRNKLELLSRMVTPESAYELIRDHVGVAGATEPVKLAI